MKQAFAPLTTPRLRLRSFQPDDLPALLAYRNDPAANRYQAWDETSEEEARLLIAEMRDLPPGTPGRWLQIAIAQRESNQLIGDFGLCVLGHEPRQAEVGVTLARAAWGQGFASEAYRHLLDYLFDTLALHRIFSICDCENTRSVALLERVGLRREGHFVQSRQRKGSWRDEYLYALLHSDWQAMRQH
jgi:RimJ/RimL family protein N-acetyltransferase